VWVTYLKAKIHRAQVTEANLHYQGSVSIGKELLEASGIQPFEKVEIYNITNGERFATYAIPSEKEGNICINGAAAWKASQGDTVIIASYCMLSDEEAKKFHPKLVFVGENNKITTVKNTY